MKKQYLNLRSLAMILSLSGLIVTTAAPVIATAKDLEIVVADSVQPTVKHIASDEAGSTFLVKMQSATPVKFEVKIVDKTGVLFSQIYEEVDFAKAYKILFDEKGDIQSSIIIKKLPEGKPATFNISSADKLVTEVAVKKLQ